MHTIRSSRTCLMLSEHSVIFVRPPSKVGSSTKLSALNPNTGFIFAKSHDEKGRCDVSTMRDISTRESAPTQTITKRKQWRPNSAILLPKTCFFNKWLLWQKFRLSTMGNCSKVYARAQEFSKIRIPSIIIILFIQNNKLPSSELPMWI